MEFEQLVAWAETNEPIMAMLLKGEAADASEAEERYLDAHIPDIVALVQSDLSDREFRDHPLIAMLFSHGSREWEDYVP